MDTPRLANNSPADTMEPAERAWETLPASGDFRASEKAAETWRLEPANRGIQLPSGKLT